MENTLEIQNIGEAISSGKQILSDVNDLASYVNSLNYIKDNFSSEWSGEDVVETLELLDNVTNEYNNNIIPCMEQLGSAVVAAAQAVELLGQSTSSVGSNGVANSGYRPQNYIDPNSVAADEKNRLYRPQNYIDPESAAALEKRETIGAGGGTAENPSGTGASSTLDAPQKSIDLESGREFLSQNTDNTNYFGQQVTNDKDLVDEQRQKWNDEFNSKIEENNASLDAGRDYLKNASGNTNYFGQQVTNDKNLVDEQRQKWNDEFNSKIEENNASLDAGRDYLRNNVDNTDLFGRQIK